MATDTGGSADQARPTDYQRIPKPIATMNAEARFPAGCMIWGVAIGMGVLIGMMLCWGIANLGTINWGALFH